MNQLRDLTIEHERTKDELAAVQKQLGALNHANAQLSTLTKELDELREQVHQLAPLRAVVQDNEAKITELTENYKKVKIIGFHR